jgi:uncharacterized protein
MNLLSATPLSNEEINELGAFLASDRTPEECMDIVTLDGYLTALAIGPALVPPSVWLPLVWSDEKEPSFASPVEAEYMVGLLMRRYNDILRMFGEKGTGFEPLLYAQEVDGETESAGETNWCAGFMEAVDLSPDAWQPLFDDRPGCALLMPMLTLGTDVGQEELEKSEDPEDECEAALEALGPAVEGIYAYWRLRRDPQAGGAENANLRARALRLRPNDPCPCGSGRKFKKCCAAASTG